MSTYTHLTAPTQFVQAGDVRFAYRRFGKTGTVPLVFLMHFLGTMDYWDPAVTDGFAKDREVILFNNAGVSNSSGQVPESMEGMAKDAATFVRALRLERVDVLGLSIGGFVGQALALAEPELVRRLILVGTGPRGGEGMKTLSPEGKAIFAETYHDPYDVWIKIMFRPSQASLKAGAEWLTRIRARTEGRDPETTTVVHDRQTVAVNKWGEQREGSYAYLKDIRQPTLVVNGSNDVICYTVNSFVLQQTLPNAQLIIYPDSAHGALYQFPELFVQHSTLFLDAKVV
jgi:pimeloyl-ACP methyl ester carboxylesterase